VNLAVRAFCQRLPNGLRRARRTGAGNHFSAVLFRSATALLQRIAVGLFISKPISIHESSPASPAAVRAGT
jgi:hypothetical protein